MKIAKHWVLIATAALGFLACQPATSSDQADTADNTDSAALDSTQLVAADTTATHVRIDTTASADGSPKYIEGAFTVPAAMEVVYGLYDKNIECSKWLCKPHEAKRFESKATGNGTLHTRAAGTYPIETAEGKKMLLLTETLSREKSGWESCHACAPILGAAMFEQIDGAWFIEALQKDLGELGSWGQLPANKLVQFGPEMYGVLFNNGYTGQGITENEIEIIGIVDGQFNVLINENTSYSNEGAFEDPKSDPGAYSYNSDITFEEHEPGKPYDLILTTKGRRPQDGMDGDGPIVDFKETKRFRIQQGVYKLVSR